MRSSNLITFALGTGLVFVLSLLLGSFLPLEPNTWRFHGVHGVLALSVASVVEWLWGRSADISTAVSAARRPRASLGLGRVEDEAYFPQLSFKPVTLLNTGVPSTAR